jgi:Na+/citrate or Na+/malate symporter
MSPANSSRNIFLALVLSLILTFLVALLYTFYPLIHALLASLAVSRNGTGGAVAVAGGLSRASLLVLALLETILFFIILALLERRRV